MNSIYIEYQFVIKPHSAIASEILIAELGQQGFESFVETSNGVLAYIQKKDWNLNILDDIFILSGEEFSISYSYQEIAPVNWNEEWEKNFTPIEVDGICSVRAPFHAKPNTVYDIVIEPKMSFGTGHHQTTYMMLQFILEKDFSNLSVLDMGCGTGVLAIASALKGASIVNAIDIDSWCFENASENVTRNCVSFIKVEQGDVSLIKGRTYDVILANINRNILLSDMDSYVASLNRSGLLIISGFYEQDEILLTEKAESLRLTPISRKNKDHWSALEFQKE